RRRRIGSGDGFLSGDCAGLAVVRPLASVILFFENDFRLSSSQDSPLPAQKPTSLRGFWSDQDEGRQVFKKPFPNAELPAPSPTSTQLARRSALKRSGARE